MTTLSTKTVFFILLLCCGFAKAYAQDDFDNQIRVMAEKVSAKLSSGGKKSRVAVANFLDLQNSPTELGKYIAESFSVELTNTELEVIDRSRVSDLLSELKMSDEKLLVPENALKLGELAGIQYIITGTVIMLDKSIDITVKGMDIQKGTIACAMKGRIARTEAINELFRSQLSGGGKQSAIATMSTAAGSEESNPIDDVNQVKVTSLRKVDCVTDGWKSSGIACFENHTGKDLHLYAMGEHWANMNADVFIGNGSKGCTPPIRTGYEWPKSAGTYTLRFYFKTQEEDNPKYGVFTITLEGCKTKSVVLHPKNFRLSSEKPQ